MKPRCFVPAFSFSVLLAIALFGEHVSAVHALAIALIAAGGLMLAIF